MEPLANQPRSTLVVEPVARAEVSNTGECLCRPAADQKGRAVAAQEYVLAQEPAGEGNRGAGRVDRELGEAAD
ncbi:hypothetical protein [Streptomyces sp. NPDC059256]|uniref:hypothetical protein n=1 Tax=Streptomyces sp. NPDC059256 TaxID=3346794 RepID=UPI0036C31B99